MRSQHSNAFATSENRGPDGEEVHQRCNAPGCEAKGEFPAPRDRLRPRPYLYFCLEHVRAYNAGWDYYRGMSSAEIDADRRLDVVWRRQTWALGGKQKSRADATFQFDDPLAAFQDPETNSPGPRRFRPGSPEALAQLELGLEDDFDVKTLKVRYKALVKKWHPDTNGGSRDAEERLKSINAAYKTLQNAIKAYTATSTGKY